ncbi:hypothetical protein HK098_001182 [Nowakowskiella sp. JEL0407]|nr:hypothetical protein HK098_001182 [Nowakowskiella sp. JEL0407]
MQSYLNSSPLIPKRPAPSNQNSATSTELSSNNAPAKPPRGAPPIPPRPKKANNARPQSDIITSLASENINPPPSPPPHRNSISSTTATATNMLYKLFTPRNSVSSANSADSGTSVSGMLTRKFETLTTFSEERNSSSNSNSNITITSPSPKPLMSPSASSTAPRAPVSRSKPKYQIPPSFSSKYALHDELGIGGYGYIFSAIRRKDSKEVAVKLLPKAHVSPSRWTVDPGLGLVPMELWVMKNVSHNGIIKFLDLVETEECLFIVMELFGNSWKSMPYVPNAADGPMVSATPVKRRSTDLFELLETMSLTENESKIIFIQVIQTLHHLLYYHGLVHGDIKDENVLIARSSTGEITVKLIDFGATTRVKSGKYLHTHRSPSPTRSSTRTEYADCSCNFRLSGANFCGTLEFAPPEILRGDEFYDAEKAQVWSCGVLLYDMVYRCMPFADVKAAINRPFARNPTVEVTKECLDLLDWMLEKDANKRPSLEEILESKWVKG